MYKNMWPLLASYIFMNVAFGRRSIHSFQVLAGHYIPAVKQQIELSLVLLHQMLGKFDNIAIKADAHPNHVVNLECCIYERINNLLGKRINKLFGGIYVVAVSLHGDNKLSASDTSNRMAIEYRTMYFSSKKPVSTTNPFNKIDYRPMGYCDGLSALR